MAPDRYRSPGIAPSRPVLAEFSGKKLSPRFPGVAANGVAKFMRDRQRQQFLPRRAESANQLARANRVRIEKGFIEKCLPHCGPKIHLLSETLSGLEKRLDPQKFVRVHLGRIVNISRIVAAHAMMNGIYELELNTGARLSRIPAFHQWSWARGAPRASSEDQLTLRSRLVRR
jgi:hypothetical protein